MVKQHKISYGVFAAGVLLALVLMLTANTLPGLFIALAAAAVGLVFYRRGK